MAVLGILSESGIYIAQERGYFAQEGLAPEFVTMDSGARALPALAASQVDVSGGSLSPAYLNAAARGLGMKIVAELNSNEPDGSSGYIVVRKDLTDSGAVRDWPDLRGMRAAVSARGSVVDYQLARGLDQGGLTITDVDVVEMSFPDMVPAFGNRSIDVASMTEPLVTIAVERGLATRWRSVGDYLPGEVPAIMSYSPDFLAKQPELGHRWVTAYLRGARDYNAAFRRGEGRDDVIQILARHTNVKDTSIYDRMGLSTINPNGTVRLASLYDQQAWWGEQGFLQGSVDLETLVDSRFTEAALQQLGRVEP
jgi:NitT/TauT family transport system substrate-binding protein